MNTCSLLFAAADKRRITRLRRLLDDMGSLHYALAVVAPWDVARDALHANTHDLYLLDDALMADEEAPWETLADASPGDKVILILGETASEQGKVWLQVGATDVLAWDDLTSAYLERALRYAMKLKRALEVHAQFQHRTVQALKEKNAFLNLLQEIATTANQATTIEEALTLAIQKICAHIGWPVGHGYLVKESTPEILTPVVMHYQGNARRYEVLRQATLDARFSPAEGLPGIVLSTGAPARITDVNDETWFNRSRLARMKLPVEAGFAFPVLVGNEVVAVLEFFSEEAQEPDEPMMEIMGHVGTQLGRVFEREWSNNALRESTELMRAFVEALPGLAFILDEDGRYVEVFATQEQLLPSSASQLKGRRLHEVLPQERADQFLSVIRRTLATGRTTTLEYELDVAAGTRWFEGQAAPMLEASDDRRMIVWISHDITKRKQGEVALRESEERLRALTEAAVEAIITTDSAGQVVTWNQGAEHIFGYTAEEIIGQPVTMLAPTRYRSAHLAGIERVQKTGKTRMIGHTFEIEGLRKNGEAFPIELSLSSWQVGGAMYYGGIIRDTTERRRIQEALRESEERYRLLFASAQDAIVIIDAETKDIVDVNDAALQQYGYARQEMLRLKATDLSTEPAATKAAIERVAARSSGHTTLDYRTHTRKDGRHFPVEISSGSIMIKGRNMICAAIRDITTRKEHEETLRRSRELLRSLTRRLQAVREEERMRLSREVHDVVGQALTGLRMDLAMIEREAPTAQETLRNRIDSMKQAIDDTVQVARRIAHDLRPGILDDLGVLAALEWEAEKFEARTGIACTFTETIAEIDLDPEYTTAIFRICQEILTNVARHAGATQVNIDAAIRNEDFVLTVSDNGRGIREEDLTNTKSLGLLSMRERVLPWDGCVDFHGVPDAGTMVTVTLPLPHHQPAE